MESVIRPSNNQDQEVIADIDVSYQHPTQQFVEGVSAIALSKTCSVYPDIDMYGAPKTVFTFTRRCTGKCTSRQRKTSDAPHTTRKLVCHKDDTSCVSHRRSQLLSPARHATVGYGETLETMLGVVV